MCVMFSYFLYLLKLIKMFQTFSTVKESSIQRILYILTSFYSSPSTYLTNVLVMPYTCCDMYL